MTSPRHRSRRRLFVAAGVAVAVVVGVGVAFAVGRNGDGAQSAPRCPEITVVAAPDIAPSLITLSQHLPATFCGTVQVYAKDSEQVLTALTAGWRADRDGPRPDVWVPDSSAWVRMAIARPSARALVPEAMPSVVSSPLAIAVTEPVARAYGWPKAQLSWKQMLAIAQAPSFAALGHPEWGAPRIGVTDPETSSTGVLSLTAIAAAESGHNVDGALPRAAVDTVPAKIELLQLGRVAARNGTTTADLFAGLRQAALNGPAAAIRYLAATPASEQQIFTYNQGKPSVPLAAGYLTDGSPVFDYPYVTLTAPWVGDGERQVAAGFDSFLGDVGSQQVFLQNGFRRANGTAPAGFRADAGSPVPRVKTTLTGTQAGTFAEVTRLWTVLREPTKTTNVWDVSQSMSNYVPSAHATKVDLMRQVGLNALSLFTDDDVAESWVFTTALPGGATHKVIFPLGSLTGSIDGIPRRTYFADQINAIVPNGHTPLYQATLDAYQRATQTYLPGDQNIVIVLTDGRNDDPADPLTLQQTLSKLRSLVDPARPVRLLTIGFGADADGPALKAMAQATAGRSYLSPDPAQIGLTFLDAITSI